MSTSSDLEGLLLHAQQAKADLRFADAAERFAVAADLAEETGHPTVAQGARTMARRALVVAWARARWPDEDLRDGDVDFRRPRPGQEPKRFGIYRRRRDRWSIVTISNGRVRLYRA